MSALHEDLFLGISREAQMVGDPFWAVDHCFTADGDPACQDRFKEMGINGFGPSLDHISRCSGWRRGRPGPLTVAAAHRPTFPGEPLLMRGPHRGSISTAYR